jgi:hypothetical protein
MEETPANLRKGSQALAAVLPNATLRELAGQSHNISPKALTPVLARFFAGDRAAVAAG